MGRACTRDCIRGLSAGDERERLGRDAPPYVERGKRAEPL